MRASCSDPGATLHKIVERHFQYLINTLSVRAKHLSLNVLTPPPFHLFRYIYIYISLSVHVLGLFYLVIFNIEMKFYPIVK